LPIRGPYFCFAKNELLTLKNPHFDVSGIKIVQETAEKELLDKNRGI
jgi:hypothetical protein